nr:reverse transcriptase domain-containing protein [Tanacetum cinerariifolium]
LTLRHCDTINAAAGGTFIKRRPEECYDLIKNMTAHHNDLDTSAQRSESSSSITSSSDTEIAALKAEMAEINKNLMKVLQVNQQVKSVTPNCETCGGPYSFNDWPVPIGNTQNGASHVQNPPPAYQAPAYQALVYQAPVHQPQIPQPQLITTNEFTNFMKANYAILKNMQTNMTSLTNSNLELKNIFGQFMKMNTASSLGSGTLPGNIITNPNEDLKGITTRSGTAYQGPTIPTTSYSLPPVVERETESTKDTVHPTNTEAPKTDFLLKEVDAFLALEDDPTSLEVDLDYELKICEAKTNKSSIDESPEVELKDLLPHLKYAFLEGDDKLPVIIVKDLSVEEKTALITVLKSHKRAIAWKLSDIKGIDPEFCTHKILMEEDIEPAVQHQKKVNPKIHDVIKNEVHKLRDAGLIYPIFDSPWVSPVHCVSKKGSFTVVKNEENELILTRLVTGWCVCVDYYKLNEATRKDHFPLPFMDQMLERLARNEYNCFLDGFSGYFQVPIDPKDQEKPHSLVHMERFLLGYAMHQTRFREKMLKWCEDTNLCLNWEKSYFMLKEGIVLSHKISRNGIEVDKAKVDIAWPMTRLLGKDTPFFFSKECVEAFQTLKRKLTEALILIAPDWDLLFELMCDASDFAIEQSYQAPTQQNQVVPLSELEKIKRVNEANMKAVQTQINNVKNELRNEMKNYIQASMSNQTNELKNMMASLFQMNTASTSRSGSLPSNTIANPKGELKDIITRSGIVLDGPSVPIPPLFINLEEDERTEETLTDQDLVEYTIKKKLGLPELISTRMTLELANRAICTPAGIVRDVFVPFGKFIFLADFVIIDYESDPRVHLILGRPFLRTARALIDVHGEEMILRDGDERLNHQSGNPTFPSHSKLNPPKVKDDVFDPEGGNVIKSLNDNPTPNCVLKPLLLFPILVEDSDSFLKNSDTSLSFPEFEIFIDHTEETNSGSTTTHADYSLPKYDSFLFEIEPDQGKLTSIVMKDNLEEPRVHVPNVLTTHPTLMLDLEFIPYYNYLPEFEIFYFDIEEKNSGSTTIYADISLPDLESFNFDFKPDPSKLTSIADSGICEDILSTTNVNLPHEADHSPLFAYVVWIFISFLTYPMVPLHLFFFGNEDTIFDPGIANHHFPSLLPDVSHRCETFMKFNVYLKNS